MQKSTWRPLRFFHGFAAVAAVFLSGLTTILADEPYQRFLQKLRDEQLFDLALIYLNDLQDRPGVGPLFKSEVDLERGLLLYQSAALLPSTNPERPQKLDNAEASLKKFLDERKQHPRRGEARLKLGELLLTRADEAKTRAGEDFTGDIPEAIEFYTAAHEFFESTVQELAQVVDSMKGARIDPADSTKVAIRQKVRENLRQAQLFSAKAIEERGRSRAQDSPQRKSDLEQSLKMFSDLYTKEQTLFGIRSYALFYRSGIQATLGQLDSAIDGYQRIADETGDELRLLQTDCTTALVRLLADQEKFLPATERGDKWLSNLRPDEKNLPQTIDLKIQVAEVKKVWAEKLRAKDANDRVASKLLRDVRGDLQALLRVPGAHLDRARELLGQLGMESAEKVVREIPKVKDFGEAIAAAQERIDRAETNSISLEAINLELQDEKTASERRSELSQQLAEVQSGIDIDQQQAIDLLQTALRLFKPSDDREMLFDARFRLGFLLLKQQRPWEAMAVAEFLARSSPGNDPGLRAAAVTLAAFSDLLRSADTETKKQLTGQLQPFAQYLVQTWPQSNEAAAAASALVQLSLISKDYAQAEQFLKLVPTGPAAGRLRREAGVAFYAKYLSTKKEEDAGKNSADSADSDANQADSSRTSEQLRELATELLETGVEDLKPEELDAKAVDAQTYLARLLIVGDKAEQAAKLLFESPNSPLSQVEKLADAVPARTAMEVYRTAIQLLSLQLAEGKISSDAAVSQMKQHIQSLQDAAVREADGNQTLAGIFVALARDLKEQLANASEVEKRKKISEALQLVAVQAGKSDSFNTRFWAADTIVSVAQEMQGQSATQAQSVPAFRAAEQILTEILAREKSQPGWINPPTLATQIRLRLAQCERGIGDYKASIEALATILEQNNGLLDVQMEAARTYQSWGSSVNSGFHKVAIEGGRPNPKTGEKLIWGWGKIQQMTVGQPDYSEQFFEARYQLAYSRYQYAEGLKDPKLKQEELARAEKDILSTAKLFPQLGGPAMKRKYEQLLKTIRKAQ